MVKRALPDPLVPVETDIRDLDGFMLNVERLMASELWALSSGDEFKAAVGLWCRAWKQIPAGSLPDDDRILAAFSGAGQLWPQVKEMALRGFILCADGRLYHQVLCADVDRAAIKKRERRDRTRAATEARQRKRDDQRDVDVTSERDVHVTTSQRQGQGQGQEEEGSEPNGSAQIDPEGGKMRTTPPDDPLARFWHETVGYLVGVGIAERQAPFPRLQCRGLIEAGS